MVIECIVIKDVVQILSSKFPKSLKITDLSLHNEQKM